MSDMRISGDGGDQPTGQAGSLEPQDPVKPPAATDDGRAFGAGTAFDPAATPQDIYSCFRLLLGRAPSVEEWAGHSALAGDDLRSVVRSYLESREFADRGLIGQPGTKDIRLTRADGFVIYTAADDLAVGKLVAAGIYEPGVAAVFREVLRPGMVVVDVGANIGFFTMLAASIVGPQGSVLAIEPNLLNVRLIEASRRANGFRNTTIAACGVGKELGILSLASVFSNGATSPVGDMLSDLMTNPIVPCVPLPALMPPDRRIDFIKIDVEGAEYLALAAARDILARWRPVIASEFSPGLLKSNSGISGREYLEFFAGLGYRIGIVGDDGRCAEATVAGVLESHASSGMDHIDILLRPLPMIPVPRWRRLLRGPASRLLP